MAKNETLFYKKIYEEYFIGFIASELQAGPRIIDVFGYDIIFTPSSAFFAMEYC